MLSGLFAGLAGVLYALQNQFAAPDFVYFVTSGDTVIFNVMGGIGTLVGPIVGAGFFLLLREGLSRYPQVAPFLPPGFFLYAAAILVALAAVIPGRRLSPPRYWMVGAAVFLALCHVYPSLPEIYLIPVGLIFIAIVIFLPQGLLGFARRWLNR
ncbi:MAG: hypothetical protein JO021_00940, partial [Alphaproteobacteria bacterium]|nr:hypothetical protein [Alphaproteobacteria bacterium]